MRMLSRFAACVSLAVLTSMAQAQECAAPAGAQRLESERYVLYYEPVPALALNKQFALALTVCPKAGAAAPAQLRVDARMPAHQHGMNTRPSVVSTGPNRYKADGLLLHMPGTWELMFEVEADGRTDKLNRSVDL